MNKKSCRSLTNWIWLSTALFVLGAGERAAAQSGSATDPEGDTFGEGEVNHDLLAVSVRFTSTDLVVSWTLAGPVTTDPNDPSFTLLLVDLDTDQDGDTGIKGRTQLALRCPDYPDSLRADFQVIFAPPGVLVTDVRGFTPPPGPDNPLPQELVGSWSVTGNTLTARVPLNSLAGDDGVVNAHFNTGTIDPGGEATDCAPDGGFVTSAATPDVPAMTPFGYLGLVGVVMTGGFLLLLRRRVRTTEPLPLGE